MDLQEAFYKLFPEDRKKKSNLNLKRVRAAQRKVEDIERKYKHLSEGERMYRRFQELSGRPFDEPIYVSDGLSIFPDGHMEDGW